MYMNKTLFEEEITFDLELNKDVMDTILQSYKTTYVMNKMYNTPEYNNMMTNVNKNIENEFINLEDVQNAIMKKIASQQKEIDANSKILNDRKKSFATLSKKEKTGSDIANAADPRYKNSKTAYALLIAYISIQVISIVGLLFLYYKSYTPTAKSNIKNNVATLKKNIDNVTQQKQPYTSGNKSINAIKPINANKAVTIADRPIPQPLK